MNLKRTPLKVIISLIVVSILVCLALLAAVFWMADPLNIRAPSDQKLISVFFAHKESFEKLKEMVTEDNQRGCNFNYPHFKGSNLNASRRQEYIDLISKINPGLHVGTGSTPVMYCIFSTGGILAVGSEWEKGIVYAPNSYTTNGSVYSSWQVNGVPSRPQWIGVLLTNLDDARTLPVNIYLRPLETNWFLIYHRTD